MSRERILELLRAYPAGQALLLGSKGMVLRGSAYYREGRLEDLVWRGDGSALLCSVAGEAICRVDLSPGGDRLAFACPCARLSAAEQCEHVVCAVMSLKNLLDPHALRMRDAMLNERERLARILLTGSDHPQPRSPHGPEIRVLGSALVMEIAHGGLHIAVQRQGKTIGFHDMEKAPPELRPFCFSMGWTPSLARQRLVEYLYSYGDRHPIILKTAGGEKIVRCDAGTSYTAQVVLDASSSGLRGEKSYLREGEAVDGALVVQPLVFEPAVGRFGVAECHAAEETWNRLVALKTAGDSAAQSQEGADDPKDELFLSEEAFNDAVFLFPSASDRVPEGVVLKTGGREAAPRSAAVAHEVSIEPVDGGSVYSLQVRTMVEGAAVRTIPLRPLSLAASGTLAQAWRAKRSQAAFLRAYFKMAQETAKDEARRVIREALAEETFGGRRGRRTAREFLGECLAQHFSRVFRLALWRGEWLGLRIDFGKTALPFRIVRDLFGEEAFRDMTVPDTVLLPGAELLARLSALGARLREEGISLTFRGAPVRRARWEIRIAATARPGIDWFEIRPEIRWDGRRLRDISLETVMERGGIVERAGELFVLEADTMRVVESIGRILRAGGTTSAPGAGIVRVPRLRILDWIALRSSGVAVRLPPEADEILRRLAGFEVIDPRPVPGGVKAKLRPYQREGWSWLAFLYEHRFGACLADDMGLGKTLQAICLLAGIKEGLVRRPGKTAPGPHLVVVPPSLLHNWENEIAKFAPKLRVASYTGTRRHALFGKTDVILTTYAIARLDIEKLARIPFDVIVFDEAQAVKNLQAETTGAVRRLQGSFKLAMTGTPLENHVGEYFSILDLAVPGLLGDHEEFQPLAKEESSPLLDLILRRARPFVLRRTKEAILKDLPPKTETDIYLDLTGPQKLLYERTVRQVRGTIDEAYRTKTGSQARIIALTALLRLRQICVSPRLLEPGITGGSPKVEFLVEQLGELKQEGHAALVFSQFTSFLDLIEEDLRKQGLDYLRLDGSTPVGQRKKRIERFQEGGAPVFLLSLKAGGQGLNLTRATYVYHLDPWWNPAVENQASDRAHRIGQRRSVTITRLLMRHTIEEKMMTLKARKSELFRAILDEAGDRGHGARLTRSDFDFLLAAQAT